MKLMLKPSMSVVLIAFAINTGCSHRAPLPGRREYIMPISSAMAEQPSASSRLGEFQSPVTGVDSGPASTKTASVWRQAATQWLGTPYRIGGASREGIDCPGSAKCCIGKWGNAGSLALRRISGAAACRSVPIRFNRATWCSSTRPAGVFRTSASSLMDSNLFTPARPKASSTRS